MKKQLFVIYISILISCFTTSCKQEKIEKESNSNYLINSTLWMQRSEEYKANCFQAFNLAKMALDKNLENLQNHKTPAIILDIDETVLDNSEFQARLIRNKAQYNNNIWAEWVDEMIAKTVPGAIEFLYYVKSRKVEILYITNRTESAKEATIFNMARLGFPNIDTTNVVETYKYFKFKTSDSGKESRRQEFLENYNVILYIGDNLADFEELYEKNKRETNNPDISSIKDFFGTKYIILPNPMYGDWESNEIIENRINAL